MTWARKLIRPKTLLTIALLAALIPLGTQAAYGQVAGVQFGTLNPDGTPTGWANSTGNDTFSGTLVGLTADPIGGTGGIIIKTDVNPPYYPETGSRGTRIYTGTHDYSVVGGALYLAGQTGTPYGNYVLIENDAIIGTLASGTGAVWGGLTNVAYDETTYPHGANDNTVIIRGKVGSSVYGGAGMIAGAEVKGNTVKIESTGRVGSSAAADGDVVGGAIGICDGSTCSNAVSGVVSKNTVEIYGKVGTAIGGLHEQDSGGTVGGATLAEGNKVIVYGGVVNEVKGGAANGPDATSLTEKSATIEFNQVKITGFSLPDGTIISRGTVTGNITGGFGYYHVSGNTVEIDALVDLDTTNNTIISGGISELNDYVAGANVSGNKVTITGARIIGSGYVSVRGGFSKSNDAVTENSVDSNIVNLTDITVGAVTGGESWDAGDDNVTSNEVYLTNVTVDRTVAYTGDVYGGLGTGGDTVTDNKVYIQDNADGDAETVIEGDLYGGAVDYVNVTANVKDNFIYIKGGTNTINGMTVAAGELKITGGETTFGTAPSAGGVVTTAQSGKNITVQNAKAHFYNTVTATNGQIIVNKAQGNQTDTLVDFYDDVTTGTGTGEISISEATVNLKGDTTAQTLTTGAFKLNGGGILNVGTEDLDVETTTAAIASGGVLNINHTSASEVTFSNSLTVGAGSVVNVSNAAHILSAAGYAINGTVNLGVTGSTLETSGSNDIEVLSGGSILLTANAIVDAGTGDFKFTGSSAQRATLDVGSNTLKVTAGELNLNGAQITLSRAGSTFGKITTDSSFDLTVGGKSWVTLNLGDGDVQDWIGETVIETGGTNISGLNNIDAGFYNLFQDGTAIKVSNELNTFTYMLNNRGRLTTPNITEGIELLDRIADGGRNPDLIRDLRIFVEDVAGSTGLTAAQAEMVLRQLIGESLVNANAGVINTALKTQSVVYNRLDRIRDRKSVV